MAIILPHGLTTTEIRVLQEYRLRNIETLTVDALKAIKHPAGGGEAPAVSLVSKGFLSPAPDSGYVMTQKGKDFIAMDPVPLYEETASAAADPDADDV